MSYGVRTSGRRLRSRASGEGHDAQSIRRSRARSRADCRSRPAPPSGSGRQHPPRALHTGAAEAAAHRAARAAVDPGAAARLRRRSSSVDRRARRRARAPGARRRRCSRAPGSRVLRARRAAARARATPTRSARRCIDVDHVAPRARGHRRAAARRAARSTSSTTTPASRSSRWPTASTCRCCTRCTGRSRTTPGRSTAATPPRSGCRRSAAPSSTRRPPGCAAVGVIPNPIDVDAWPLERAQGRLPAVDGRA